MKSFVHVNAQSVREAVSLLAQYRDGARLNAGGSDLIGVLKDRILTDYPEAVVNIKTIPGLDTIEENSDLIRIGALATLAGISSSPVVNGSCPILAEAAGTVAAMQIRNMATIGGNLCQDTRCWYYRYPDEIGGMINCFRKGGKTCPAAAGENQYHAIMGAKKCFAVCPSDTAVALTALGAQLTATGAAGTRQIPVEKFYTNLGNALGPDEMITAIDIPKPAHSAGQVFLKFTIRKPIDFALVSVASIIAMDEGVCASARIVLGAVAPTPVRALQAEEFLIGKKLSPEIAAQAADIALSGVKPLAKNAYKVQIAKTVVKRAIEKSVGNGNNINI